ncbi:MAG: hypothetical protein VZQ98_18520 [Bacteroidales bacterium]|nr:hypothetical protein [Bacteroidales bacterium]
MEEMTVCVMTLELKKVGAIDMGVGCLYNLLHSEKKGACRGKERCERCKKYASC